MSDARKVALAGLIDDAGLFPPARKPMSTCIPDHAATRDGPAGWVVSRLLCPASQLHKLPEERIGAEWCVGVVNDKPEASFCDALQTCVEAAASYLGPGVVESIEIRPPDGADMGRCAAVIAGVSEIPPHLKTVYLELNSHDETLVREVLAAVGAENRRAARLTTALKLRCGGLDPMAFPDDAVVASVVRGCVEKEVSLKATAGLHHPLRTRDPRTGVLQHGFVNLLAAMAFPDADTEAIIADDGSGFALTGDALWWHEYRAEADDLALARRRFVGFGSCSVLEPVADLEALGWLPVELGVG